MVTRKRGKTLIRKRSIGHRTSVSLEDAFWHSFNEIAAAQNISVVDLVLKIDRARKDTNLSSAIRLFVLNHYRQQTAANYYANGMVRPSCLWATRTLAQTCTALRRLKNCQQ
jgi:predicted DNA-binding ribbon-helix-helix protein